MKTIITILFLSICSFTFGQPPKKIVYDSLRPTINLTDYQKQRIESYRRASDDFQKLTREYQEFLFIVVDAHHIPTDRIIQDSVKILPDKISIVLKYKK